MNEIIYQMRIYRPSLFISRLGEDLFCSFSSAFHATSKLQTSLHLFFQSREHTENTVANARNATLTFFHIVSQIYELRSSFIAVANTIAQDPDLVKTYHTPTYISLCGVKKEICKNRLYGEIRNRIGFHDGEIEFYKKGIALLANDPYMVMVEYTDAGSNNMWFTTIDPILKDLNISDQELAELAMHTLKVMKEGVDNLQKLFYLCAEERRIDHLLRSEKK